MVSGGTARRGGRGPDCPAGRSWVWTALLFFALWLGTLALYLGQWLGNREEGGTGQRPAETGPWTEVDRLVAEMAESSAFRSASIGFCLLGNGPDPVAERMAGRAMIPASTLKVVTAATALEVLGPDYRFVTRLRAQGHWDAEGVLEGDLIVAGGGDPAFKAATLRDWAVELADDGLRELRGDVVGDARFFPEEILSGAWNWGDVGNYYGAGAAGLNVDRNRYRAVFRPGAEEGDPAELVRVEPEVFDVTWRNSMRTGPPGSGDAGSAYAGAFESEVRFSGTVPAGVDEFKISGAIPDPPRQAAAVFRAALLEAGVEVHGEALTDRMRRESGVALGEFLPGSVELRTQESEPLASIVQHLHETSDNLEAECCYRLLARHAGLSRGVEAIEAHWSGRGLHFEGLRMEDGSGLARANVIRPLDLARLLLWARDGPQGDVFFESLNARYEGRARLKGGAMSRVRTFAGYVETRTRGELVFVLMVNHQDAAEDEVAGWRDRLMAVLVDL